MLVKFPLIVRLPVPADPNIDILAPPLVLFKLVFSVRSVASELRIVMVAPFAIEKLPEPVAFAEPITKVPPFN